MKISKTSVDLPAERFKTLAIFMGWQEKKMTETESPNYEIDNPQSFTDYIVEKDSEFMLETLKRFNMQEAENLAKVKREEADAIISTAEDQAEFVVKRMFNITVL